MLDGGPATIGGNDRAIDLARVVGGEEERQSGDIGWLQIGWSQRGERLCPLRASGVQPLLWHRLTNVRLGRARTDRVAPYAPLSIHPGGIACQADDGVLGGGVGGARSPAVDSGGRG